MKRKVLWTVLGTVLTTVLVLGGIFFLIGSCSPTPTLPTENKIPSTEVAQGIQKQKPRKQTVCVNMIVKNETAVIRRCLESVKPMIDSWIIVDTGSTDGTQKMIKEFMKDIPGELHERPWVNFGHNRTEALNLAKGKADYILIIDADEVLEFDPGFERPHFDKDFYFITTSFAGTKYGRVQLINNKCDWKWEGVLHEYLSAPDATSCDQLNGVTNVVRTDGARSQDPQKFHKDAAILEAALKDDPNNTRNVFYLAQSYKDAGENQKAIDNYVRRISLGGWDQEIFWSLLQMGILQENLEQPREIITNSYKAAYRYRPSRAEPLYRLAVYLRGQKDYQGALEASRIGLSIPTSNDVLFVEHWMYDYGLLLEYSIATYWTGDYIASKNACQLLLTKDLPQNFRDCVERNLRFAEERIAENVKSNTILRPQFNAVAATGTDG